MSAADDKTNQTEEIRQTVLHMGWQCPVCGRGNAPWVSTCPCTRINNPPPIYPGPVPVNPYPQPWAESPLKQPFSTSP